jgi:hypothetical protein
LEEQTATVELTENEVVRLVELIQPQVLEIRRKDPDGPVSLYPEIVLYQKLIEAAQWRQVTKNG